MKSQNKSMGKTMGNGFTIYPTNKKQIKFLKTQKPANDKQMTETFDNSEIAYKDALYAVEAKGETEIEIKSQKSDNQITAR